MAAPSRSRTRATTPARRAPAPADGLVLLERAAAGDFPVTLWVEGPDEALKAVFLAEYRRAWAAAVPESAAARVLRPAENGVDEILSAYHNVSLFTPRELTLVLEIEDVGRSDKRVAALAEGVARPAGESRLVLVESAAESARKSLDPLRAACAARWSANPLEPRALLAWGERHLASRAVRPDPGTLEALLESCEGESIAFFNQLAKLESLGASGRVTKADVALLMPPVVGADLPEFLAAVALGRGGIAAQKLGRLLAAGESEGTIMFSLGNLVGGALRGWARFPNLSATLGRRRPPQELARALDAVYRAEAAWKSGRVDSLAALEQATREVAAG